MSSVVIFVQCRNGTHTTNRVRGLNASSTVSAEVAAHRLAAKIFGGLGYQLAETTDPGMRYTRRFQADQFPENGLFDAGLTPAD